MEILRVIFSGCFFLIGLLIFIKSIRVIYSEGIRNGYVDLLSSACFVLVGLMIWFRHIP